MLNAVLKVFISKSLIHACSTSLDLQRGPLRTLYIIPSLHVLKPAVSINTAHCTHSAGTTSQQGLHPTLNHSCQAESQAGLGFGVADREPLHPHNEPLVPQHRAGLDLLSPGTQRSQPLGEHPAPGCAQREPGTSPRPLITS